MPRWIFPIVAALVSSALAPGLSISAQAATIQIVMEDLEFVPAEASAKVGDTIEWVNKEELAHTATARNGDWDVKLPPKKTVTLVLEKAGTIDYYCRYHPNMKGKLAVMP